MLIRSPRLCRLAGTKHPGRRVPDSYRQIHVSALGLSWRKQRILQLGTDMEPEFVHRRRIEHQCGRRVPWGFWKQFEWIEQFRRLIGEARLPTAPV